jgi:hypothetical protein
VKVRHIDFLFDNCVEMGEIRGFERAKVGDFRDGSKPKNRRVVGRDGLSERAVRRGKRRKSAFGSGKRRRVLPLKR